MITLLDLVVTNIVEQKKGKKKKIKKEKEEKVVKVKKEEPKIFEEEKTRKVLHRKSYSAKLSKAKNDILEMSNDESKKRNTIDFGSSLLRKYRKKLNKLKPYEVKSINDLPNDILAEISQYFYRPKEIFNFMTSSKSIYSFFNSKKALSFYCCSSITFFIAEGIPKKPIYFAKSLIFVDPNVKESDFMTAYKKFKGVENLSIVGLKKLTNKSFKLFKGIRSLNMSHCSQDSINDKGLSHLKGIKKLNLFGCSQKSITKDGLLPLVGIKEIDLRMTDVEHHLSGNKVVEVFLSQISTIYSIAKLY